MSLRSRLFVPLALVSAIAAAPAIGAVVRPIGVGLVTADDFTGTAGPLAPGQIEVGTLSTRAATVTGGDVLLGVRGVTADDTIDVIVNGTNLADRFTTETDPFDVDGLQAVGYVDGLFEGVNDITVTVAGPTYGSRNATLPVTNHPLTGPVFSGPHQELFSCRVHDLKDFAPGSDPRVTPQVLDEDCSFASYVRWYYLAERAPNGLPFDFSNPDAPDEVPYDLHDWVELTEPYGAYPSDMGMTVTTNGDVVPAIARLETTAINRGITRIASLDDPAARGSEAPFEVPDVWNERVIYNWGASCGIGRQQGINTPNEALSGGVDAGGSALDVGPEVFRPAVLMGYMTAHSSMTIFNTHCNQVLSAETFMMVREHMSEQYGRPVWVMGNGASGGAIQQYTTMNMYPGLLDGGVPLVSFPDVITTAMSPADCRLLRQVFTLADSNAKPGDERELPTNLTWDIAKQNAITGHAAPGICEDWDDSFADLLVADRDCSRIPVELRYSRESGVGERCTLQDNLRHFLGVDENGFGRRTVDNNGVQYGYQALLDGVISIDEFLYLNRNIGGMDADGYGPWDPGALTQQDPADMAVQPRMSMDPALAADLYRYGFVGGRGAIDQAPVIDINLYADPVPVLGFHDQVRSYMTARRVEATFGERETMSIWSGAVLTNDAWSTMHSWLDGVERARAATGGVSDDASWSDEVGTARPAQGGDACVVTTAGYAPAPLALPGVAGHEDMPCEQVFRPMGSTRIAAGGPDTEDIIKCQRTAPQRVDYDGVTFTDSQFAELQRIFAGGVCDWALPGVGEVARSETWQTWGNDTFVPAEPQPIAHIVARS
jgi:hypothetical protein